MKNHSLLLFLLITGCLFIFPTITTATEKPSTSVLDFANLISQKTEKDIERKASALLESEQIELKIVTMEQLYGLSIQAHARRMFDEWKIGGHEQKGVLFVTSHEYKQSYIMYGRGIRGLLSDELTYSLTVRSIFPYYKKGQYDAGIKEGVDELIPYLKGKPIKKAELTPPYQPTEKERNQSIAFLTWGTRLSGVVVLLFFIYFIRQGGKERKEKATK